MRHISSGDERLRRRILEAFVTHLRAHLAAASAEFRLQIPVQSAARMKAILAAEQAQQGNQRHISADRRQAPSQRGQAAPAAAPVPAASIQMNTREKQERAMDHVGMQAGQDTSQGIALAVELEAQGRTQEAIALYESLLRQVPNNGKVHFNLAMLLTERGRLEEAEAHCRAATQSLRDYPDAWGLYAYLLFLLRRESESLECARRAVALGFPRKRLADLLKLEPAAL
jgi:tetratricopeptide (TPR) repeat protein